MYHTVVTYDYNVLFKCTFYPKYAVRQVRNKRQFIRYRVNMCVHLNM